MSRGYRLAAATAATAAGWAFIGKPQQSSVSAPQREAAKASAKVPERPVQAPAQSAAALLVGAAAGVSAAQASRKGGASQRAARSRETVAERPADNATEELPDAANAAMEVDSSGVLRASWQETAIRRMWTRADSWHVHAISGGLHTIIGFFYLLDIMAGDVVRLTGGQWSEHVPFELVLASMVFGAINAVSGLQPSLLPRPTETLPQLLGFGEDGNLPAAGFVNTAGFYFFLTYQSLRVLPEYPVWLQPFDPIFSATAFLAIFHAIFLINSWVSRGKLSREFAIGMSAPLLLNVPVSLHLVFQGQWWVEALSTAYPGWPEVFFSANYALAWAGSMVTLILSLYERRVCDLQQRALMTVFLGLITFTVIPLRAALLVPSWFQTDQMVMLTLNPP